jgi:predicted DNA-binding transcriptional regulator AlpA
MRVPPQIRSPVYLAERELLLTTSELAQVFRLAPATLKDWRCRRGMGPRFIKVGRAVRYRMRDVETWLKKQTARS